MVNIFMYFVCTDTIYHCHISDKCYIFEKGWLVIKLLNTNYLVGSEPNIARLIWSFVGEHDFCTINGDFDPFFDVD